MVRLLPCWILGVMFTMCVSINSQSKWPPKDEICTFESRLDGEVLLPGNPMYEEKRQMKDTTWTTTPGIIVSAKSIRDVRLALAMARKYHLQPTLQSSGHDYNGRSTAKDSLQIDMSGMKHIIIIHSDPDSDTGSSAVLETGNTWEEVYERMAKEGFMTVGTACLTVGMAGYLLGGGHSPLTRTLGLGVDNVLGMTMVTADNKLIYVDAAGVHPLDPFSNTVKPDHDLFWALLGGGGGTLGVIISFKIKIHRAPPGFTFMQLTYPMQHPSCGDIGYTTMQQVHNWYYDNLHDHKLNGIIWFDNVPGKNGDFSYIGSITVDILYMGLWSEAWPVLEPLANYKKECDPIQTFSNFSTVWDHQKTNDITTGYPGFQMSRFLQKEDLKSEEFLKLATKDMHSYDVNITCPGILVGGNASVEPAHTTSASPDFRSAVNTVLCIGSKWKTAAEADRRISELRRFNKRLNDFGRGIYYNEADPNTENWKVEFWGSMARYNRLLEAKRYWDKESMFWCLNCVGSDLSEPWSKTTPTGERPSTRLCSGTNMPSNNGFPLIIFMILISI